MNKEKEKVLLDLIDELIAELDVTYTDANITTKNVKVQESNCSEKSLLIENFVKWANDFSHSKNTANCFGI